MNCKHATNFTAEIFEYDGMMLEGTRYGECHRQPPSVWFWRRRPRVSETDSCGEYTIRAALTPKQEKPDGE